MSKASLTILAQKVVERFHGNRSLRLGITLGIVTLTIAGVLAIGPEQATDQVKRTLVTEVLNLPVVAGLRAANEIYLHETRIRRGDTLASLLDRLKVKDAAAAAFLNTSPAARAFSQLIPGRLFRAQADSSGKLFELHYLNGDITHTLIPEGDAFAAKEIAAPAIPSAPQLRAITATGVITSSLFAATDAADIPDAIATQLVDIFSTDIDFHRDLRKGDRFSVVFETVLDGEGARTGRVLAAEFTNQGHTYTAIWFNNGEGKGDYYTLDGLNTHKAFLRSPLEFSRISSGFSMRFHPILRTWRAHTGVDYAAPMGTHIKATADGVVEFAGVQSGYGNVIILRHQDKYTTLYGHMQSFAPGIHRGTRVSQGDIIGNVGMTGLATGPHVHYEFRINGTYVDPLSVAVPVQLPLAPQMRPRFEQVKAPQLHTLALLRDAIPANFE